MIHLHTHSEFSILDGCGSHTRFVKRAVRLGMKAIAFTEHGTMRGVGSQFKVCEAHGLKAIYGFEAYLVTNRFVKELLPEEKEKIVEENEPSNVKEATYQAEVRLGVRPRYHVTLLAETNEGLQNLYRISSIGWVEGFAFKRPRIDLTVLSEHSHGIICLSGCPGGLVARELGEGNPRRALRNLGLLLDIFGAEHLYVEIMPHTIPGLSATNAGLVKIARKWNLPLVATQDAHYSEPEDGPAQEALLAINTKNTLFSPTRFRFTGSGQYWLKSAREMAEGFLTQDLERSAIKEAIRSTDEIGERCSAKFEPNPFAALLPEVKIGDEFASNRDYLQSLCAEGWEDRDIESNAMELAERDGVPGSKIRNVYKTRLENELRTFEERGVVDYFLIIRDIVAEARRRGIAVGPGRGSAAGSLALYLLGITDVDPIKHGLMFDRFLAPGRIDLPDVDLDFEDRRRDELIDYLSEKYGRDHVARVGTMGTLGARSLIRDLGRVMMIGMDDVDRIAKAVVDSKKSLRFNASMVEEIGDWLELYPDVGKYADVIGGCVRSLGVHAAGVVVSPVPIAEITPVELRDDALVTAFDMGGVQDCGLLKIDLLGLRTLSVLKDASEAAGVNLSGLKLDDEETLDAFTKGDFVGVFQFDSISATALCRGVEFSDFEVIVAMTALDRPGTARSGLAQTYLARNKGEEEVESIHPIYDAATSETFGVPVYQEHVIRLCRELGGFTAAEADKIRKLIGKSKGAEALAEYAEKFVDGAVARAMGIDEASALWDQLCEFGGYSFNKSHATAYSILAYWTQYLKIHYPEAFFYGLIKNEKKQEKILGFVKEAEARGIKVLPPTVQRAGADYRIEKGEIIPSLTHIKFVSKISAVAIEKMQPFSSFVDFIERTDSNKRVVVPLISSGALRDLVPNTKLALEHLDKLWKLKKTEKGREKINIFMRKIAGREDFDEDKLEELAVEYNPFIIRVHPLEKAANLIERVGIKVKTIDPDRLATEDDGYFLGAVTSVKLGEYEVKGRSRAYATLEIDGGGAKTGRFKLESDLYELYDERGLGLATYQSDIVLVHYHRGYKLPVLQFIVSLSDLDNKLRKKEKLDIWERMIRKDLPRGTRVLANIKTILDRNDREMAFLTVMSTSRAVEGVCFSSTWGEARTKLSPGDPVKVSIKKEIREGKTSIIYRGMEKASLP